jgi:hypothetical protein
MFDLMFRAVERFSGAVGRIFKLLERQLQSTPCSLYEAHSTPIVQVLFGSKNSGICLNEPITYNACPRLE